MQIRIKILTLIFIASSGAVFCQLKSDGLQKFENSTIKPPEVIQFNHGLWRFDIGGVVPVEYIKRIPQTLVKNGKGLFMLPDGTGRVYKIVTKKDGYEVIRQDSTNFYGYNFGFYAFSFRDTLYSFGGYGYWRHNGHLRVFAHQKGDWEIENLNREVPFAKSGYFSPPIWFNNIMGKLWIGYSIYSREGLQKNGDDGTTVTDSVFVLDIQKKEWSKIGLLEDRVKKMASVHKNLGSSPWGQLLYEPPASIVYLLDFDNNQILQLDRNTARHLSFLLKEESVLYFKDSTLMIQSLKSWIINTSATIDSIVLSKEFFHSTGNTVYSGFSAGTITARKVDTGQILKLGISIAIGIFIASLFFIVSNGRRKNKPEDKLNNAKKDFTKLYDDKEIAFLKMILTNSNVNLGTQIDELNKILGVAQKTAEVQKKQRSEIIISINKKWRYLSASKDLLIKKRRVEKDKRSFEYFIESEVFPRLKLFL